MRQRPPIDSYNVCVCGDPLRPVSRLKRCRRHRHGLGTSPVVKQLEPRGEEALLPCPRTEAEGLCKYRRMNHCTDEIHALSLQVGSACVVERGLYEKMLQDLVAALDYRPGEVPGPEVERAAAACIEAYLYLRRAMNYTGQVMTQETDDPSPWTLLRYQGLGLNAWLRRRNDVAEARIRELNLDVERIREETEGCMWAWWRESCRTRWWRRECLRKDELATA